MYRTGRTAQLQLERTSTASMGEYLGYRLDHRRLHLGTGEGWPGEKVSGMASLFDPEQSVSQWVRARGKLLRGTISVNWDPLHRIAP
jgi:hypothetical protein